MFEVAIFAKPWYTITIEQNKEGPAVKTVKLILKICGCVMVLVGVACLIAGYMEELKKICCCSRKKAEEMAEFADYADVE